MGLFSGMRRKSLVLVLGGAGVVAIASGIAVASIPDSGGVIHGCVQPSGNLLPFPQRVQIPHQALEPLLQHMGVDLRRRNVGVAEQGLHDAEVGAIVQEVAGEGVAEHVRADPVGRNAGIGGEFAHQLVQPNSAEMRLAGREQVQRVARHLRRMFGNRGAGATPEVAGWPTVGDAAL